MTLTVIDKQVTYDVDFGVTVPFMSPAAGASVAIRKANGGVLAQLYSASTGGTLLNNPFTLGADARIFCYVESGKYDLEVTLAGETVTYADFQAVDDIVIEGPKGTLQFADVASMKAGSPFNQQASKLNFANYLGQKVSTVVNNTISNDGGADYIIWLLSEFRSHIQEPAWQPDEKGSFLLNSNYVAIPCETNLLISQYSNDVNSASFFADLFSLKIDLQRKELNSATFDESYYNLFYNGFIEVQNILYPINVWGFNKSVIFSHDQGDSTTYNAWPQGKVYKKSWIGGTESKWKVLINRGSSHVGNNLTVWSLESSDEFQSFSGPFLESGVFPDYQGGNTAWSAGTDGTRQYFITRQRGDTYSIGDTIHVLNYSDNPTSSTGYTRREITLNNGTEVPILYHSFAKLGSGKIAAGYHYTNGQVGIALADNNGISWESKPFPAAAAGLVEPSLLYDEQNDVLVGFLRTQSESNKPRFYVTSDEGDNYTLTTLDDIPSEAFVFSPITLAKAGDNYYAFMSERYNECRMYLLIANAQEAITNGASAFKKYFIGNTKFFAGTPATGAGAGDLYANDRKISIFYGEHGDNNKVVNVVKMDIETAPSNLPSSGSSSNTTVRSSRQIYNLTSFLNAAWSADDTAESTTADYSGLFGEREGSKFRLYGLLKTSDATQEIANLPEFFEPRRNIRSVIAVGDSGMGVIRLAGKESSNSAGRLQLLASTGSLNKIQISMEFDLIL